MTSPGPVGPDPSPMEVLTSAARTAGMAPSVHNTQPWRWRVHRDRLDLYADRRRQLTQADRDGRLLTLSCGAALHHARVVLAANGWQPMIARLASSRDDDHLAQVWLGDYIGVQDVALRRYLTIHNRRTDRRPLVNASVPASTLAAMRAATEAEGAHLAILDSEQISELAVAVARAEALAAEDDTLATELASWVGGSRPTGTGVPETVIPTQPPRTRVPVRDFGTPGALPADQSGDRAASYVVIFGDQDTPAGWLQAGEALSSAWVVAAEQGVAVLPFSSPVELTATRVVLHRLLAGLGYPYLVLRLGLANPKHPLPPYTPRLDPTETVEIPQADRDE